MDKLLGKIFTEGGNFASNLKGSIGGAALTGAVINETGKQLRQGTFTIDARLSEQMRNREHFLAQDIVSQADSAIDALEDFRGEEFKQSERDTIWRDLINHTPSDLFEIIRNPVFYNNQIGASVLDVTGDIPEEEKKEEDVPGEQETTVKEEGESTVVIQEDLRHEEESKQQELQEITEEEPSSTQIEEDPSEIAVEPEQVDESVLLYEEFASHLRGSGGGRRGGNIIVNPQPGGGRPPQDPDPDVEPEDPLTQANRVARENKDLIDAAAAIFGGGAAAKKIFEKDPNGADAIKERQEQQEPKVITVEVPVPIMPQLEENQPKIDRHNILSTTLAFI